MEISIKKSCLFICILLVAVFSCKQEDSDLSSMEGNVRFGGISLEFAPMGSEGSRLAAASPWVHIFPNSAEIVFTNKVTKEEYTLEYNPNDFSTPYSISLPHGAYEFYSKVEAGLFSDFLPYEAEGEFVLDSQNLEISLLGKTDYGLITVKNELLDEAVVSKGNDKSNLVLLDGGEFRYKYVKGGTLTTLKIIESILGSTIKKEINVVANTHYNFVLKRGEGTANITDLSIDPFELVNDEIIIGSPVFYEENGTIKCPQASPGDKGEVDGKTYEAVDRALLIQRRDEGASLSCVCTSLVTDMSEMFLSSDFNQNISSWDVSNVTNMYGMFMLAYNFNQPIGNWDVSAVTNMSHMFRSAESFDQPIKNWDVGKVTDMSRMFNGAMFFSKPIGDWNVGNVTNMFRMFAITESFNQPIGDWNVSKVTNMGGMFSEAGAFSQPLGNWDVGNVTNMSGMFTKSGGAIHPIGNWNVSKVENMDYMFHDSSIYVDLSTWCVEKIPFEPENFVTWIGPSGKLPIWGTCPD